MLLGDGVGLSSINSRCLRNTYSKPYENVIYIYIYIYIDTHTQRRGISEQISVVVPIFFLVTAPTWFYDEGFYLNENLCFQTSEITLYSLISLSTSTH